ncbi:Polyketide cyclase / dehydrase and lipid transport [Amycolatopsis arida]|uniref:Polyketide cyclase / dehydrase and lipid transport n=1 Tax=Amycolatopsis arida TaxID=587909 RepID=A0A1I5XG50_9PSEU|nr:SRPBCC family protein [Amycolatopsis arida]TDX97475.1 polyketide cyclase/dehydrase/lipid transport protein [Amycolatopsis arida]SFQ30941.1 Polyketide cyclase / dehydrase and lipid transport [Amycolatopsis arida]
MRTIQEFVDIRAPITTVYDQWTQFETFPSFLQHVDAVEQRTDTHLHWVLRAAGARVELDVEIVEQRPDERVVWQCVRGPRHRGLALFLCLDDTTTRLELHVDYQPETVAGKAVALAPLGHLVRGELARFKDFVEQRGRATGAWRGEVRRPVQRAEVREPGVADPGGTSRRSIPPLGD